MWVHCDLNEFIMLNEQMEGEATTRRDILHFFGQEIFFLRERSGNLVKLCLWQTCVHVFLCTNEIITFSEIFHSISNSSPHCTRASDLIC